MHLIFPKIFTLTISTNVSVLYKLDSVVSSLQHRPTAKHLHLLIAAGPESLRLAQASTTWRPCDKDFIDESGGFLNMKELQTWPVRKPISFRAPNSETQCNEDAVFHGRFGSNNLWKVVSMYFTMSHFNQTKRTHTSVHICSSRPNLQQVTVVVAMHKGHVSPLSFWVHDKIHLRFRSKWPMRGKNVISKSSKNYCEHVTLAAMKKDKQISFNDLQEKNISPFFLDDDKSIAAKSHLLLPATLPSSRWFLWWIPEESNAILAIVTL